MSEGLARVYPPATAPGLQAGTAASNAAGAGTPEVPGHEKASTANQHNARNYGDLAK